MKTVTISIPKAVVTSLFTSEKNGAQYVTLSSPAGEFKLSCPQGLHDFNQYMESDRQDFGFEVNGRIFNNRQSLEIQKVLKPSVSSPK